jgi:type III secretory pathway component EscV
MISGVTSTEFIVSQIINVTFLLVIQIALTVVMGFWIFEFPMKGSYFLAVVMMFLQGICGKTKACNQQNKNIFNLYYAILNMC